MSRSSTSATGDVLHANDSGRSMRRRTVIAALLKLAAPHAGSQSARPLPKIGVIRWEREQLEAIKRTLPQALEAHGYAEGKNIAMLFRSAEESPQRADEIMREFVGQRVSVIVAAPTPAGTRHAAARRPFRSSFREWRTRWHPAW